MLPVEALTDTPTRGSICDLSHFDQELVMVIGLVFTGLTI